MIFKNRTDNDTYFFAISIIDFLIGQFCQENGRLLTDQWRKSLNK